VPELQLYLATTIIPFWQATEAWLAEYNVDAPFWAFAWPGGLAIARHLLDHPQLAAGKRVLDFAAGCGIAGLAAARAGAASVDMRDINMMSLAACTMNARANGLTVNAIEEEIVGGPCRWDLILAGDVCYEGPMTRHILPWLRALAAQADVLVADPGRAYLPADGMEKLAAYTVPTNLELENKAEKLTSLYWLKPLGQ
jgi:predicted nicotinamide N-methyase